jgi:hypothetical protein
MPTSRNARGVDILIYGVNAHIYKGIQVKALSKRSPVPLGKSLDRFIGDWWIIVTNAGSNNPVCFIMKPKEVRLLATARIFAGVSRQAPPYFCTMMGMLRILLTEIP